MGTVRSRVGKKLKILNIIITPIAIDVMDNLFRAKVATKMLFHHEASPSNVARLGCMGMIGPFEIDTAPAHKPTTSPVGIALHSAGFRESLPSSFGRVLAIVPKTAQHLLNVGRSRLTDLGTPYLFNMLRREFAACMGFAEGSASDRKLLHPILNGRKANAAKIGYGLLRKLLIDIFSAQPGRISMVLHRTSLYHMPYSTTTFTS